MDELLSSLSSLHTRLLGAATAALRSFHDDPSTAPMALKLSPAMAALAAGAGIGAILVSSCCVVPLLLAGLGISGVWLAEEGGLTASLQPYLIVIALVALKAAWGFFLLRRLRLARVCARNGACARPATPWITGALLTLATF